MLSVVAARMTVRMGACALMLAAGVALPASAVDVTLRGAGSTFVAPLVNGWISQFEATHPGIDIAYEAVGSGEGVSRFIARKVDFAGSDNRLSETDAKKIEGGAVEVPSTAGLIVLAYNLPGLNGRLKLPQDVYADIFLGKIQRWNDARIAAANPGVSLPALNIAIVGRQDSSGTTFAFTQHLSAVSKAWADGPGVGKIVVWPSNAMLARGSEGLAAKINITEASIGYVEYGFALRLGLPTAALQNKDGQFVAPTAAAGAAALAPTLDADLNALEKLAVNPAGAEAYPIVTYSWLLLHPSYPPEQAQALASFINFAYDQGQDAATHLGYIPLPQPVVDQARAALARFGGKASSR